MNDNVNEIEEITISIPVEKLTEDERISLFAVYAKEREKQTTILPTAISTDDEKINFAFRLQPTADIAAASRQFADITMELCEKAKHKAGQKQENKQNSEQRITSKSTHLPLYLLLKIRSQIFTIRNDGKYNMLDISAVQREAYEKKMYEMVNFIEEHKADYTHFILTGDLQNLTLSLYPLPGSRVVLDEMPHDLDPVSPGTVGVVEGYDDECEILMNWENGRRLKLIPGVDRYHAIK